jgi:copper chaperone CopZ
MKTLLALAVLAVAAPTAVLACPCHEREHSSSSTSASSAAPGPGEARVTVPVSGMHCDHCVSRVTAALAKVDGVKTAQADLDKGVAVVIVERSKLDVAKLVGAVDAAGYKGGTPTEN